MEKKEMITRSYIFFRMLLSIALLVILPTIVIASTYYISPNGDDLLGNGNRSNPYKTFGKIFSTTTGGDIIVLMDGLYTGGATGLINEGGGKNGIPPSGTSWTYRTVIKAERDGGAILDGEGINRPLKIRTRDYLSFEGIKFKNSIDYVSAIGEEGPPDYVCKYIKFKKCAFYGGSGTESNAYVTTVVTSKSNNILYEDCWAYGKGRYKFHTYKCTYVTYRRCVVRFDPTIGYPGKPQASWSIYDSSNCVFINCISVDGQQGGDTARGSFYMPANYIGSRNNLFLGCIVLNDMGSGFAMDPSGGYISNGNQYINCVAWLTDYGININGSASQNNTIDHCTIGANRIRGFTTANATGTVLKNSIMTNNVLGVNGAIQPTYSIIYNNSTNYGAGASAGAGVITVNPLQSYISRIEDGSPAKREADDGGDMGANVIYRYGADDSLYDTTLTNELLWPFPNEDRMKTDFAEISTWGFTGSNKSLTEYIWTYLNFNNPYKKPNAPANLRME